jgi:ABC-2 type transport system ATP-binding protein
MDTPSAVSIRRVVKRYGSLTAVDGVDLDIRPGEFFGLLGPNGAGKTTLISMMAGLNRPDSGAIAVMGHDTVSDFRMSRRTLGVVPQELVFDPFFTVRETLRIQSGYFGIRNNEAWIDEILENLDLTQKANANMRSLSGGMKRRVLVGQALVHRPPVIVLDEPTAGVDVELRQTLWKFIRRLNADGHTIVLTTHYLEEAETLCNRIAMLKAGKVVALDSTANLLQRHSGALLRVKAAAMPALPPGIAPPAESHGAWRFALANYDQVAVLLDAFRQANLRIEEMEIMQPDLEEVFVQIMSKSAVSAPADLARAA